MKNFDSYKILESTRETVSQTHGSHRNFLKSVIEKATKAPPQTSGTKKKKSK